MKRKRTVPNHTVECIWGPGREDYPTKLKRFVSRKEAKAYAAGELNTEKYARCTIQSNYFANPGEQIVVSNG
jgi:hypothetical protein